MRPLPKENPMFKKSATPAIDIDTNEPIDYKKLAINTAKIVAGVAVTIAATVVVKNAIESK